MLFRSKQLALALAALATALVAPLLNLLTKLFRSGGSSLATGAGGLISRGTSALTGGAKVAARPAGATTGLGLGGGEAQAGAAGSGGALAVVGTAVTTTASQAVLATVGLLGATTMFSHLVVSNALLADFPIVDPFATSVPGTQGKISEYVEIEKLVFIDGCPNARCENPDFPVQAEYSITIRPKDDYSIRLTEVTDTISTSHSSQAWEDEGRTAPEIPDKVRTIDDFAELYPDQTINAGEEVSFTYSETLDENYNHAAITNSFEIKFFPGGGSGVHNPNGDNAITGEVIILGDYSKGAGCWPTSGRVSQLPGGGFSHQNADAFDIAENAGTTIWSPFDGEICVGGMDDQIYGLHLQLFADGKTFVMGHLRATNIRARCSSNQRDEVFPGMPVGEMGTTGRSTGPHLHWGLRGSNPRPSTLATLMPNGVAVKEDQYVESCYAHQ